MDKRLKAEIPKALPNCQIHDAVITDTPESEVVAVQRVISDIWSEPVRLKNGREFVLPVDVKVLSSMSGS